MWRLWIATLFWGFNWPAVKILLSGMSPWTLRAVGLGGGAALLFTTTRVLGRSLAIARGERGHLAVAALLNVAGFNLFAVFAQLSMPTSRAAILTFTMPFWGALLGWLALGERIDRLRALSLLLGAAGLGLLAVPFWPELAAGGVPYGLVYVLGAAITWAAGTVYMKLHPVRAEPLAITTWQIAIGALVCAAGAAMLETPRFDVSDPWVMAAMLFHVTLPQALSYAMWFGLVRTVTASTATLGMLLIPIFGVCGSVLLLAERPTPLDLAGFALILGAVVLDQVWRRR